MRERSFPIFPLPSSVIPSLWRLSKEIPDVCSNKGAETCSSISNHLAQNELPDDGNAAARKTPEIVRHILVLPSVYGDF